MQFGTHYFHQKTLRVNSAQAKKQTLYAILKTVMFIRIAVPGFILFIE